MVRVKSWKGAFGGALLALCISAPSAAAAATAIIPQHIPERYAQAARLVTIGPRRQLNLRCSGNGPQTVLLEAGSHTDSTTWFRLQPLVSSFARVCAYDRAGYGFSSEGPQPRNLDADVADLHALIRHAGLKTPLVLVGHSLGSNIVRRYAERYPTDTLGMVLVDPPAQDVGAFSPEWEKVDEELSAQRFAFIRQCEAAAEKGALTSPPPALKDCLDPPNPLAGARVNAALHAQQLKPAFWRTLLSELRDNVGVFRRPVPERETHGALPLIVLTAADTYADAPPDDRKMLNAAREQTQLKLVATSTRGERLVVPHASHDIQLDQPEVVASAIATVLQQAAAVK